MALGVMDNIRRDIDVRVAQEFHKVS